MKGVLLIAFGKPAYAYMAYNMAASIKHFYPDLPICLATDGVHKYLKPEQLKVFDEFKPFKPESDAGWTKLKMFELTPYDHTLFLDVDGCVVTDIEPWIDSCIKDGRPVMSSVSGEGGLADKINYAIWAANHYTWAWFDIPLENRFQAVQTSCVYFDKSDKAKQYFEQCNQYRNFPKKLLTHKWSGATPDELIFSGVAAKLGLNLRMPEGIKTPLFIGFKKIADLTQKNIGDRYYALSLAGNRRMIKVKYRDMYERLTRSFTKAAYSLVYIYSGKHIQ